MHGFHRIGQLKFVKKSVEIKAGLISMLEQPQQHARSAKLQHLRHIHAVGIANDDMQAAILVGGVRFVARVDNRPFKSGLQSDLGVDIVGTLAQLITGHLTALTDSHATGAGVYLACDEVQSHQASDLIEGNRTGHHIVLVRAPAGTFAVHVVAM